MISVHNLKRIFQNGDVTTEALRGVDLSIKDGEYVIITGRSGAGKSTLMYQMGLLDEPTSGTIEIDGVRTTSMSETERTNLRLTRLGYVFQDYALLPELTALENVMVPLLMEGRTKEESRNLARKGLKRVGLDDKLDNLPSQLSGGQQQRVSIARAIANEPSILFADEPTANLDSQTADTVMQVFQEIHEAGQTIIMVTHELSRVPEADRVIVMSDGVIEKETKG